MSRSINKAILVGHITRDAELSHLPSGISVAKFGVATNHRYKDKQSGEWKESAAFHNVLLWKGENLAPYLLKGSTVYVEGRIDYRSYEAKDGTKKSVCEIVADEVVLLGGKSEGSKPDEAEEPIPF